MIVVVFFLSLLQTPVQSPPRDARPSLTSGTGILRGVVVDEPTGAPIAGARVTVTSAGAGFDRRTGPAFMAETSASDDGRFEIVDLPAGEFVVTADPGEFRASHLRRVLGHDDRPGASFWRPSLELAPGEVKADIKLALPRALAVEGRVIDEYGDAMTDVSVTARSEGGLASVGQAVSDDRGRFRLYGMPAGQYTVCAEPRRSWRGGSAPDGVATRYDQACLKGLTLAKGDLTPSIQLQLQRVDTFTLSGTVVSSTGGDLANARVIVFGLGPDGIRSDVGAEVRNGQFIVRGLLPGEYLLQATIDDIERDRHEVREMASQTVQVEGTDLQGLTLTTIPAVSISGRIERDPRATAPLPSRVIPRLIAPLDRLRYSNYRTPSTVTGENATFTIKGIFDRRVVAIPDLPRGWFVASVHHGKEDITDQPREFRAGDDRPVVIVVSNRSATLRARPVGGDGKLAPEGYVVLVPADPRRWNAMPYFDEPSPDKEGFVTIEGRAPGDYVVTGLTIQELMGLTRKGGTLEPIARAGRRISLVEGETLTIDVPVTKIGDRQ